MADQIFVDLDGRKATRISEVSKDKCLLLYHDKDKNVFRLGLFEMDRGEYRALTGEPRAITDTDPLAETAKKLAKEIGEEFRGAVETTDLKPKKVVTRKKSTAAAASTEADESGEEKPKKVAGRKKNSTVTTTKIYE